MFYLINQSINKSETVNHAAGTANMSDNYQWHAATYLVLEARVHQIVHGRAGSAQEGGRVAHTTVVAVNSSVPAHACTTSVIQVGGVILVVVQLMSLIEE